MEQVQSLIRLVFAANTRALLRSLLPLVLVGAHSLSVAQWVKVHETPGMIIFFDVPSLAAPSDNRVVNVLTDFRTPEDENDELVSMINQVEFYCEKRQRRVLSGTHYAGNLGQGKETYIQTSPGPWKRVEKDDGWEPLLRLVCAPNKFKS